MCVISAISYWSNQSVYNSWDSRHFKRLPRARENCQCGGCRVRSIQIGELAFKNSKTVLPAGKLIFTVLWHYKDDQIFGEDKNGHNAPLCRALTDSTADYRKTASVAEVLFHHDNATPSLWLNWSKANCCPVHCMLQICPSAISCYEDLLCGPPEHVFVRRAKEERWIRSIERRFCWDAIVICVFSIDQVFIASYSYYILSFIVAHVWLANNGIFFYE